MPNPLTQAGAAPEPTAYAALAMDEQFTGLWTQRSPLRDADVPYIQRKFYSAARFDSIIDGINREISASLTDKRRPGSPVFNSSIFPPVNSFYAWKSLQNSQEVIRLLLDGTDGTIYDFTPNTVGGTGKTTVFSKSGSWRGQAAFCGIPTALYYGDGNPAGGGEKKITIGTGTWQANHNFKPGTLINSGANPEAGSVFMALGGMTLNIKGSDCDGSIFRLWCDPQTLPLNFANLNSIFVTFSGLTAGAALNGLTLAVNVIDVALGIFYVGVAFSTPYAITADTGTATTGNGTTGGSLPAFNTTPGGPTYGDGGQQWKCYGSQIQNLGLTAPNKSFRIQTSSPTLARFWLPNTSLTAPYAILDENGNSELCLTNGITGPSYPNWNTFKIGSPLAVTLDNTVSWLNYGPPGSWQASTAYDGPWNSTDPIGLILDPNGNWQYVSAGGGGSSGGSAPSWSTTIGGATTDGALTWTCLGPGHILTTAALNYSYSTHAIDGTVSTSAPTATVPGPVVGIALTNFLISILLTATGSFTGENQIDQIWIWRTAQGKSTLVFENAIPTDSVTGPQTFSFAELGIPDTSTHGNTALVPQIPAPIDHEADPPPVGLLPLCYRLGRLWGILNNVVYYSAGPDAVTGNGNTQWPTVNVIPLAAMPVMLIDGTTTRGPTLFAWTTSGIQAIYGSGTPTDPFIPGSSYMTRAGIRSRFAVDAVGSTLYAMTANNKVAMFDPSGGYIEIGFPIGDQFKKVTTGAGSATTGVLYDSSTTYVSWYEGDSGDSGLFVSDGAVGWFRFSPISPPESGSLWSPRAAIIGGTSAVQAIETAPGVFTLLIAPKSGSTGPILMRDKTGTVFQDNGSSYPAWDVKGSIQLAQTGEVSEIAHIALKSVAVGARPAVSLMIDEIQPGVTVGGRTSQFEPIPLLPHSEDPPNLESSITMFSDRYHALQGGPGGGPKRAPLCHNFQLKIDYGTQNAGDELLAFAIYGATHPERRQQ